MLTKKKLSLIIVCCLLAVALVLISLLTVFKSYLPYNYPDYFTPRYIQMNYNVIMPNLYFSHTSINSISGPDVSLGSRNDIFKIAQVELDDLIFMVSSGVLDAHYEIVLRHKDSNFDPVRYCEIDQIGLIEASSLPHLYQRGIHQEITAYMRKDMVILPSNFDEVIRALRSEPLVTSVEDYNFDQESQKIIDANPSYLINPPIKKHTDYMMFVSFTQYPTLFFVSSIYEVEGKYYMQRYPITMCTPEDFTNDYVVPMWHDYYFYIGENFDFYMARVLAGEVTA